MAVKHEYDQRPDTTTKSGKMAWTCRLCGFIDQAPVKRELRGLNCPGRRARR